MKAKHIRLSAIICVNLRHLRIILSANHVTGGAG